jgi:hypothetical protein
VEIYNLLRQNFARLHYSQYAADKYCARWNGKNIRREQLPTGLYFVQLRAGASSRVAKVILMK